MDLMTMWKQARGEVDGPTMADLRAAFGASGLGTGRVPAAFTREVWKDGIDITEPSHSAERLWLAARTTTPDPETLKRFAEMVAEECARVCLDDAAGCQRAAEMMVDGEECARFDAMAGVLLDAAAAIRRHVKG